VRSLANPTATEQVHDREQDHRTEQSDQQGANVKLTFEKITAAQP